MKVAVIGTGLIGASIGLAARERLGAAVAGVDPDPGPALAAGAIDEATSLAEALEGADAAFVAVPVPALAEVTAAAVAAAGPQCVVTDVGSVKAPVVAAIGDERFVGGHPLAGAEQGGAAAARADMFEGAPWFLTPTKATSGIQLERLHRLLAELGARPSVIDAEAHDRAMATVSHLPHVLANVLVTLAGESLPATGPSFRDATRVAGANPALWAGIYAGNAEALGASIDQAIAALEDVRGRLAAGDSLEDWQARSAGLRAALRTAAAGGELAELHVVVPNRPGVIADIALTLSRAGINIADMSLAPSIDMATGALDLSVPAGHEDRARALLAELGLAA
ncbi:MAG: Prephenate dehydrogenase [Solirubrobacterales bacterium]|nr:Prephenate dehydrogenase [Solirubrobacterales bacterium]